MGRLGRVLGRAEDSLLRFSVVLGLGLAAFGVLIFYAVEQKQQVNVLQAELKIVRNGYDRLGEYPEQQAPRVVAVDEFITVEGTKCYLPGVGGGRPAPIEIASRGVQLQIIEPAGAVSQSVLEDVDLMAGDLPPVLGTLDPSILRLSDNGQWCVERSGDDAFQNLIGDEDRAVICRLLNDGISVRARFFATEYAVPPDTRVSIPETWRTNDFSVRDPNGACA